MFNNEGEGERISVFLHFLCLTNVHTYVRIYVPSLTLNNKTTRPFQALLILTIKKWRDYIAVNVGKAVYLLIYVHVLIPYSRIFIFEGSNFRGFCG